MTEKRPDPKPDNGTYSEEEIAKRMDATVRAMIGIGSVKCITASITARAV